MARFTRIEVALMMEKIGMVPLFYHNDSTQAKDILRACYQGGARVMEFTARGDFSHEVFSELVKFASTELPDMAIGIGSITDASMASHYIMMGADFIVTPSLREDIAISCNRRKILYAPGCGSLTEIAKAEELGCEIVKLFPGSIYGPDFIKAIKAPCPWTSIMPTGGVTIEKSNLTGWFEAGVTCVGMGSKLISEEIIKNKDYRGLEKKVKQTINLIEEIRS